MVERERSNDGAVRVLVVDGGDAAGLATGLERQRDGFETVAEASAATALDRLESESIDCIVSGEDLADSDGLAFLRTVRPDHPTIPFVLYPTAGSEALAAEAVNAGATGYLPRDGEAAPVETLAERVEAVVRDRSVRSTGTAHGRRQRGRQSADVVFVFDETGTIESASPAVDGLLGYDPEELVGTDGFDLVHPADRSAAEEEFFRAIEEPDYEPEVEFRVEHRDGSWRRLQVRGRNFLDDAIVEGVVVNARDVTGRREYARQLATQEERFRQIVEHLPETVIWMTDLAFSEIYYVSPGYEDLWGRSVDHLYDNPATFIEGVHPDDRQRVLAGMADLQGTAEEGEVPPVERIEYRVVHPDGTVRWIHGRTVPFSNPEGEVTRWIGIATDVTEQKARQRELEGYETLLETVPDGVFLVDDEGRMLILNGVWAQMVGKEPAAVEGAPFADLVEEGIIDPSVPERFSELLRELLSSSTDRERGTLDIETTLPGQETEHLYEAHVGLLPCDDEYRGCAVVVRDLTGRSRGRTDRGALGEDGNG